MLKNEYTYYKLYNTNKNLVKSCKMSEYSNMCEVFIKKFSLNDANFNQLNHETIKRKRFGGIIFNKDKRNIIRILIVKGKHKNKWGFPKGALEKNETYSQCALREIHEETGLLFKQNDLLNKIKIDNTLYFIIYKENLDLGSGPIDTNEISDVKWVQLQNISKIPIKVINNGLRFLICKDKINQGVKSRIDEIINIIEKNNTSEIKEKTETDVTLAKFQQKYQASVKAKDWKNLRKNNNRDWGNLRKKNR